MTSLNKPAYTLVDSDLLKSCINGHDAKKTVLFITTHGEIITSDPVTFAPSDTQLAMLYSGVPITVNYSHQSVNDQVLEVLDDGHFDAIQRITAIQHVKNELQAMSTIMRERDTMHTSERNSSVDEQAKDSWRSHYFSQAFPFTKIPNPLSSSPLSELSKIDHPNKRYTLRTYSDTRPEDDNDDKPHAPDSLEKRGKLVSQYDDPKDAEVAHGNFEFKMNLFVPVTSFVNFNKHIKHIQARYGVHIVTKDNAKIMSTSIRPETVFGQGAKHVLDPELEDCILDNWNIMLLPCGNLESKEERAYAMLPYRFYTLSDNKCVVFDLWHLLCYQGPNSYSQNGLSMTTTRDYMDLLHRLNIQFVMGVDLTCNVIGTKEGGWPSFTLKQLNADHTFQDHLFDWVTTRHSVRLSEDYLPHLYACKVELNNCINFIEDHTANQVLESLHPHIVFSHTVAYRGSSSFIETYRALSNFTKALMDHAQDDRKYLCLTSTPGHMETAKPSHSMHRLVTNTLSDEEIRDLDRRIKHPYNESELKSRDIEELKGFLITKGIRFDFTLVKKGEIDTAKYKKISEHIAEESENYGGVASKTYLLKERAKEAALEREIQVQRAAGTVYGGPDLLTGITPDQQRDAEAKILADIAAAKTRRQAVLKARRDGIKRWREALRPHPLPDNKGGSRNKRKTRRHRLNKRLSKRSGNGTSRRNHKSRKRAHTRRRR
jgi:hypothetical protein